MRRYVTEKREERQKIVSRKMGRDGIVNITVARRSNCLERGLLGKEYESFVTLARKENNTNKSAKKELRHNTYFSMA